MKKIFIWVMGVMGVMGMGGCDKIDEEEYTVYNGAKVTWESSTFSKTPVQRVYVEKFTGPKCNNCPLADVTLAGIHDERVTMVSINHPVGQGEPFPNQPDMRTEVGTIWDNWYGINAIPSAYINRDRSTQYSGSMSNIVGAITQALNQTPTVAMELSCTENNNQIYATVELKFLKEYTASVTLTVAVVEDSLCYRQLMPDGTVDDNYAHNHMLRKVVTGYWGAPVDSKGTEGEMLKGSLEFSVPDGVKKENCHIVAFISDKNTRKVLNCASCELEE